MAAGSPCSTLCHIVQPYGQVGPILSKLADAHLKGDTCSSVSLFSLCLNTWVDHCLVQENESASSMLPLAKATQEAVPMFPVSCSDAPVVFLRSLERHISTDRFPGSLFIFLRASPTQMAADKRELESMLDYLQRVQQETVNKHNWDAAGLRMAALRVFPASRQEIVPEQPCTTLNCGRYQMPMDCQTGATSMGDSPKLSCRSRPVGLSFSDGGRSLVKGA